MESELIRSFLQHGAVGVLALAFIAVLVLYIRSDRRAATYAASLKETSFDRSQLIQVVKDNTTAITAMTQQIEALLRSQEMFGQIMNRLDKRLDSDKCPFLSGKGK